jgi:hypothetical protein
VRLGPDEDGVYHGGPTPEGVPPIPPIFQPGADLSGAVTKQPQSGAKTTKTKTINLQRLIESVSAEYLVSRLGADAVEAGRQIARLVVQEVDNDPDAAVLVLR